jgi:glycosyltransferase involved in cell wall biosynthesis
VLKWRVRFKGLKSENVWFHICDHSNAPYLQYLPVDRTSITCHDVIAIRSGLGYQDSTQSTSSLGRFLQKWILNNLKEAKSIAFVSELTLKGFKELVDCEVTSKRKWQVIHNSFNADFRPMEKMKAKEILCSSGINLETPFLLHVGSGLPRKNRKLLIDMLHSLGNSLPVNVCFAGESLNEELLTYADFLGLKNRIMQVVKPNHETLVALYSLCASFVFPSLSEGFGWPVIEAQACGAPVIASNLEPMPEVSGGAALHFDPTQAGDFANGFRALQNPDLRQELVQKGFENGVRFNKEKMIRSYLNLYI